MAAPQDSAASVASPQSASDAERTPVRPREAEPSATPPRTPSATDARPAVCPYCGESTELATSSEQNGGTPRCRACLAFLDPLSKDVTQGHMGPWFLRDPARPFYPGLAFDVLGVLISRGEVTRETVIRGPGSGQFWMRAGSVPGVAHLLGVCHACQAEAPKGSKQCPVCTARFPTFPERDRLGISGAQPVQRLSAFASDEELRAGAPPMPTTAARIVQAMPSSILHREESNRTPLEITLSEEVAGERRKTLWLLIAIGLLIVVNLAIAGWALMGMRPGPR